MNTKKMLLVIAVAFIIAGTAGASNEPRQNSLLRVAAENITKEGPEGGSCSATSDDGKKTCSISCPKGKSAICSNTKDSVACRCG